MYSVQYIKVGGQYTLLNDYVHNIKDGEYLWSASFDCTVRLWHSTADWICITVLSGHTHPVRALQLTRGYIVSGDYRGFIMIWDMEDVQTEIRVFQAQQQKNKKQVTNFNNFVRSQK